jgi:hypothetical protein
MRFVVPQPFTAGGKRSYLDLWVVTGDPRYPGYKTPTIAPKPSIARVAGADHLTGGIIGTNMMLRVSSRDSEV